MRIRILFVFLNLLNASISTDIECTYGLESFFVTHSSYRCLVQNDPIINLPSKAFINSTSGTHESGKNNQHVLGFFAKNKTINYFPNGLEKIYDNIKAIVIEKCHLKEIHQSDVMVFPKLVAIGLRYNDIEVVEQNLFQYNRLLKLVLFHDNKVFHIDPAVFDHLTSLSYLGFSRNKCMSMYIDSGTAVQVQKVITEIKSKCTNAEYKSIDGKFKELEMELYQNKVKILEHEINSSTIPMVSTFAMRLQKVKDYKPCDIVAIAEQAQKDNIKSLKDLEISTNKIKAIESENHSNIKNRIDQIEKSLYHSQASLSKSLNDSQVETSKHLNGIKVEQAGFNRSVQDKLKHLSNSMDNLQADTANALENIRLITKSLNQSMTQKTSFIDEKIEAQSTILLTALNNAQTETARQIESFKLSHDDKAKATNEKLTNLSESMSQIVQQTRIEASDCKYEVIKLLNLTKSSLEHKLAIIEEKLANGSKSIEDLSNAFVKYQESSRININESVTLESLNNKIENIEKTLSKLSAQMEAAERRSNWSQQNLDDRLKIQSHKIDKNSEFNDLSTSALIIVCGFLGTLVIIILYKKILFRNVDLDGV
ncbi:unnamed protein product [Chironomus riparius]|uniref:Uncharacterized protein n=1 Tax=Chironomus riparius TaxID=315576 RepID=A0A9N9S6P8_9DIPT|nr:unnamed protein product [Chironomus riparius]